MEGDQPRLTNRLQTTFQTTHKQHFHMRTYQLLKVLQTEIESVRYFWCWARTWEYCWWQVSSWYSWLCWWWWWWQEVEDGWNKKFWSWQGLETIHYDPWWWIIQDHGHPDTHCHLLSSCYIPFIGQKLKVSQPIPILTMISFDYLQFCNLLMCESELVKILCLTCNNLWSFPARDRT